MREVSTKAKKFNPLILPGKNNMQICVSIQNLKMHEISKNWYGKIFSHLYALKQLSPSLAWMTFWLFIAIHFFRNYKIRYKILL